jgi:bifunctional non-homologous end joining protein LigD
VALEEYKQKRDFKKTPEPRSRAGKPHREPIFVVQKHNASRLHYDFRLEADGVLKSWAIPKQPSLDTATKRLAVHVEDHPLEYANFSGTIPEGQYGAGTVVIWDKGTYVNLLEAKPEPQTLTDGIEEGHIEVELRGQRLKGRFALIRMDGREKRDNWLLVKMKEKTLRTPTRRPDRRSERPGKSGRSRSHPSHGRMASKSIEFTHQDKVMFPEVGITKGEVLRFYARMAEHLLPHLRDRPVTLERLPDGLAGKNPTHFWQKHTPASYPSWIQRIELTSLEGEPVNYVVVNNTETLLYLVNQGTITFHPWFSRIEDLDRPDFILFDLDPGRAAFNDVVAVAKRLHRILDADGVRSFVKTSGKTGLHVLVPSRRGDDYESARGWAMETAGRVVSALPNIATIERSKSKRRSRVYVDVMQNVRGHHAVPPYVLRAVSYAGVSTPLKWAEVTPELDPRRFNLRTIFRRLGNLKTDPIADLVKRYGRSVRR